MAEEAKSAERAEASFWRSLFDDISIAQLLAGALAAVTSMLLASRIGIAGSVIGVAVGSIVSAVASQVYKKFLSASAEKLKGMAPDHGPFAPSSKRGDGTGGDGSQDFAQTAVLGGVSAAETAVLPASVDATPVAGGKGPSSARAVKSDAYAEAARARSRSARARKAKIQRNAVIVAAVSALVGIVLSAVVIEFVTAGQGVGTRPEPLSESAPWSVPAKDVSNSETNAASDASSASDEQSSDSQGASSDGSSSQGDASASQGSQTDVADGSQSGSGSPDESSPGQGDATDSNSQGAGSSGAGGSQGSDSSSTGGSTGSSGSGSGIGSSGQAGSAGAPAASNSANSSSQAGSSFSAAATGVAVF